MAATLTGVNGDLSPPARPRNLPNRILRAINSAAHLLGLTIGARATLAEICRYVPQAAPLATVFAHKATLAARLGFGERSIYRHLAAIRDAGLVVGLEQERKSRNGRFAVARLRLTQKAAELLGFTAAEPAAAPPPAPPAPAVIPSPPAAKMADGHTLTEPTNTKGQRPRLCNGLPLELAWLASNGVSRAGVFKLMGLAKAHGKRLSDIASACAAQLAGIKGARLYGYLAKLCASASDFAWQARQQHARQQLAAIAQQDAAKAKAWRARFAGTALCDRKQTTLYLIDRNAEFAQVFDASGRRGCMPLNDIGAWVDGIENGHLVLATQPLERRLRGIF